MGAARGEGKPQRLRSIARAENIDLHLTRLP
ncbi:MAG: hypothetical protein QOG95_2234 [Mycobacterium sp.]|nr:hypothetical protein [Mycobacterium sp.]